MAINSVSQIVIHKLTRKPVDNYEYGHYYVGKSVADTFNDGTAWLTAYLFSLGFQRGSTTIKNSPEVSFRAIHN
ncbi:hypothetical protein GCM10028816_26270 [Spirosoma lituiforme]